MNTKYGNSIKGELVLYGKPMPTLENAMALEDIITTTPEHILEAIAWARQNDFTGLRIAVFNDFDRPDFIAAVSK